MVILFGTRKSKRNYFKEKRQFRIRTDANSKEIENKKESVSVSPPDKYVQFSWNNDGKVFDKDTFLQWNRVNNGLSAGVKMLGNARQLENLWWQLEGEVFCAHFCTNDRSFTKSAFPKIFFLACSSIWHFGPFTLRVWYSHFILFFEKRLSWDMSCIEVVQWSYTSPSLQASLWISFLHLNPRGKW